MAEQDKTLQRALAALEKAADDFVLDGVILKKRAALKAQPGLTAAVKGFFCRLNAYEDREEGTLAYAVFEHAHSCAETVLNRYHVMPPDLSGYQALERQVEEALAQQQQHAESLRLACIGSTAFKAICATAQAANMRVEIEAATMREGMGIGLHQIEEKVATQVSLRVYVRQPYDASSHLTKPAQTFVCPITIGRNFVKA